MRFGRLSEAGVFGAMVDILAASGESAPASRRSTAPSPGRTPRPPAPEGQCGQALGRSRRGLPTRFHLKTGLDGWLPSFDLTGSEASAPYRFPILLHIGPA